MNKRLFQIILLFAGLIAGNISYAQDSSSVAMADIMRSNGKIYVVVAVCLLILVGLFLYVMMLDRKISRLEKNRD